MKNYYLNLTIVAAIVWTGCGGSKAPAGNNGGNLVDPSGNWTMTVTDGQNNHMQFAALFNQVGATVTANSFTAVGNPAPFSCVPFGATLANGNVGGAAGNVFSGDVTILNSQTQVAFGTFHFTGTLTPDGLSVTGTYSGMPACVGIGASGTFTGGQVPSVSGNWNGTMQPCNYDQHPLPGETPYQDCQRNLTGMPVPISMGLAQDDATGNVTGTYTITMSPFAGGTVSIASPPGILSGTSLQFSMADSAHFTAVSNGTLGMDRSFKGLVLDIQTNAYYAMTVSH